MIAQRLKTISHRLGHLVQAVEGFCLGVFARLALAVALLGLSGGCLDTPPTKEQEQSELGRQKGRDDPQFSEVTMTDANEFLQALLSRQTFWYEGYDNNYYYINEFCDLIEVYPKGVEIE